MIRRGGWLALLLLALAPAGRVAAKPNLVLILADDLGYGDVGAYGGKTIATPNLDALAAGGIRLTQGYVSHPVCGPSRAGLLTGRYQERHGYEFNPAGIDRRLGLALTEKTLADRLRAAGYATGMVGKWHLGVSDAYHPMHRGFDEYFGIREGGSSYIDSRRPEAVFAALGGESAPTERGNAVMRAFEEVDEPEYLTSAFTREALSFIDRHREEPFFLYLAYTAPHVPLQAIRRFVDAYRNIDDPRTRVYAAMVAALDEGVGAVVARLRELDLLDDTLIVFLSDNGCASYVRGACSNSPLAGFKRYHLEGGVRVPFILQWPGGLPRGTVYGEPASSLDLTATLLAAAGGDGTTEDSVDLLPFLRGARSGPPHEALFWRAGPTLAVRSGPWKLLRMNPSERSLAEIDNVAQDLRLEAREVARSAQQVTVLYDVATDPGEEHDVAAEHPEVVESLEAAAARWEAGLGEPMWPPRRSTLAEISGRLVQLFY